MSTLSEYLSRSGRLLGTLVSCDSTTMAEAIAMSGIDWAFFDLEHSANSLETVQKQIQAIAGRIFTAIRIEAPEIVFVKRALDTGCDAIVVPQVNSAAMAKSIVNAGKYFPMGSRSVGFGRAHGYGSQFANYIANANDHTSIIVQIENIKAVEAIDEIIAVPGIERVVCGTLRSLKQHGADWTSAASRRLKGDREGKGCGAESENAARDICRNRRRRSSIHPGLPVFGDWKRCRPADSIFERHHANETGGHAMPGDTLTYRRINVAHLTKPLGSPRDSR